MKKYISLFLILTMLLITSCSREEFDQEAAYEQITAFLQDYEADQFAYSIILYNEDKNLTLCNSGSVSGQDDQYTYKYRNESLNKIGSGADSLISVNEGEFTGSREEVLSEGFSLPDGSSVKALDLLHSLKTHNIEVTEDGYIMSGYIARNTIIKNTANLDNDIRFNYSMTFDSEISRIEEFRVTYVTEAFDSVTITITFEEQ